MQTGSKHLSDEPTPLGSASLNTAYSGCGRKRRVREKNRIEYPARICAQKETERFVDQAARCFAWVCSLLPARPTRNWRYP